MLITNPLISKNILRAKQVADSLNYNGTYAPDVDRVIFSLKTEETRRALDADGKPAFKTDDKGETVPAYETVPTPYPVLATTVFFADGTSVTVKNSEHDPVQVVEEEIGGRKVKTAARVSKEAAVAHAIVKRLCGLPDSKGKVSGAAYGKVLDQIVTEARDQNVAEAKADLEAKERKERAAKAEEEKAKAAEAKAAAKAKEKAAALAEQLQAIAPLAKVLAKAFGFDGDVEAKLKEAAEAL
jgi:hypothetical protein